MGGRGASSSTRLSKEEIRQRNREYLAKRMEQGREVLRQSMQRDLENIKPYQDNTNSGNSISILQNRENRIREQMVKLYNDNGSFARTELKSVNDAHKRWLQLKKEADGLRDKRQKLEDEERKKRKSSSSNNSKTFVNSYGEATKREITTSTYKRAMKRQNKNVLRNMGY